MELKHYGVKGMRWGIRKDQYREYKEKATTDNESNIVDRFRAKKNMNKYFLIGGAKKAGVKYDEDWYNTLDTGKKYIEKGETLYRVVRGVDQNTLKGRLYVTPRLDDAEMYKATIPKIQVRGASAKKEYHSVYQLQLETKKRMTLPSEKERIDTFIDMIQTKEGKKWLADNGYKKQIDELNAKQVGFEYYKRFNKYAGNQAIKFNDVYFNALKKKGYDALTDDNDAGIWSREPTILLKPSGTVKVKKVRQLSAKEINDAQKNVIKLRGFDDG